MRLIDADKLHIKILDMEFPIQDQDQILDAMDDCTVETAPNDPLTLEELLEMEGEPVWVEHCNGGEWVIVAWNIHDEIAGARQARLDADNYGSDFFGRWLAYRRKPEEGQT